MRQSHQRAAILDLIRGTDAHPTAEWIFTRVRAEIPNISLGTVYRNLNQLAAAGIIQRIHDDRHARYDGNMDRHDHFRCVRCHRIYDVHIQVKGVAESAKRDYQFEVTGYSLGVTGVCLQCQAITKED